MAMSDFLPEDDMETTDAWSSIVDGQVVFEGKGNAWERKEQTAENARRAKKGLPPMTVKETFVHMDKYKPAIA